MPLNNFSLADHLSDVFIETGTHRGDGVRRALEAGFKQAYSVDPDQLIMTRIPARISNHRNVMIKCGESIDYLDAFIEHSEGKSVTFWLDAHPSGELSLLSGVAGRNKAPLLDELMIIGRKLYLLGAVTVLIDDMRLFSADDQRRIEDFVSGLRPMVAMSRANGVVSGDILVGVM